MAPKKAAKKHAKKHEGKHHDKKHHAGKDVRRAYEHLGRLEALQAVLPAGSVSQVRQLSELAQQAIRDDDSKSAADLLRAAEHLSFAALAAAGKEKLDNPALGEALTAEFEHLWGKAEEHWDDGDDGREPVVAALYAKSLEAAETAMQKGSYRRAMEFVRAAEALAHTDVRSAKRLGDVDKISRLKG